MKHKFLAPVAAITLVSGGLLAGATSAQAEISAPSAPFWVGEAPVFLSSEEAVADWKNKIEAEQKRIGYDILLSHEAPGALTTDFDSEGNKHVYEIGLVDSLVAQTVRCAKLSIWSNLPGDSRQKVDRLARADFREFASKEVNKVLGDTSMYQEAVKSLAKSMDISEVEAELSLACDGLVPEEER